MVQSAQSTADLTPLVLPHVNGACMQLFINEIASRYPQSSVVMVVDGAGWHKADFKMPDNLRLHFLPPYSPERNPQEHIWDELREKWFHNIVFDSLHALEEQLVKGLKALEINPTVVKSIVGCEWIINCVSNGNYNETALQTFFGEFAGAVYISLSRLPVIALCPM